MFNYSLTTHTHEIFTLATSQANQRWLTVLSPNMAAGHHCQISVGKADGVRNLGYMRFGYSGASGSNENYIGLGFHTNDDLVKIYRNRINSLLLYPLGIIIERSGNTNPEVWFGGSWGQCGIRGILKLLSIRKHGLKYLTKVVMLTLTSFVKIINLEIKA
jgi:hypothetical protein